MGFESDYAEAQMRQMTRFIENQLKERVLAINPDFSLEEEAKRRFKTLCCEVRGGIDGITSYYYNDGSERGIHLFSYMIDFGNQGLKFEQPFKSTVSVVEVPDPTK